MDRRLPDRQEAARILATKRSRPAPGPAPRVGRSLSKLVKGLDDKFGKGVDGLRARWPEIVGPTLSRCTEPVKLIKPRGATPGALEIRVSGPAAALIQHQSDQILQRVALVLGQGIAERLRIVQGPIHPPPSRAGAPPRPSHAAPPPLDAAAEARLKAEMGQLEEGPLKAALLRLGREVVRRDRTPR